MKCGWPPPRATVDSRHVAAKRAAGGNFAPLVELSKHALYLWRKRFIEHGPADLADHAPAAAA
jgi:hypothetical protein